MRKIRKNYIRDKKNNKRIAKENIEKSIKTDYINKVQYEENYGKYPDLIIMGEQDRIAGKQPQNFEDKFQNISYTYGYFERGSRVLAGNFARGLFTEEEQRQYGILDVINGVPLSSLFALRDFPHYNNGRNYQLGRNAYERIVESNMTLEEYIYVMEIIMPELKTEAFKEGFYSMQTEITKKGR